MKKLFISLAISIVLALFALPVFAESLGPTTVKNPDGTYTTSGKDTSFANKQVTLLVYKGNAATQANIEYNDHILAGANGSYSFSDYQPIETATLATGSFKVLVGCEGMSIPIPAGAIYQTEGSNTKLKGINLSSCSLIGSFDNATRNYFVRVPYGTLTVPIVSAEPEVPTTKVSITQATGFAEGSNVATVKATAEDGTIATYILTLRPDASGTPDDPILIGIPYDLDSMRTGLDKYYKLINDIDLNGFTDFTPVGTAGAPFVGGLDGNGFAINNLTINSTANDVGLFGYTGNTALITGVTLNNVNVTGSYVITADLVDITGFSNVGGLVGTNNGAITLCSVSGSVSGSDKTGGLVGLGFGSISRSFSTAAVTYVWAWNVEGIIGGFVGQSKGAISDCYATGEVFYKDESFRPQRAGGFAGDVYNGIDLINCYTPGESFGSCVQYVPDPKPSCYYLSDLNPGALKLTIALTSEQMRDPSSFTGWDFDNIWAISGGINHGFPTLREGNRAELSGISFDVGSTNEPFAFSTHDYTVTMSNAATTVPTVSATAVYPSTTVAITQASGFFRGSNVAAINVTADNGESAAYTVTFTRVGDDNCNLSGITLDAGNLNEFFDANLTDYTVTLPVNASQMPTVLATAQIAGSTIVYTQASGFDSGSNVAEIKVTAKNGESKTYRVIFNIRISDSNADLESVNIGILYPDGMSYYPLAEFDPSKTEYVFYDSSLPSFPEVYASPALTTATVHITQAIEYTTKGKNVAAITVTAEDGTVKVYTVAFKRYGDDNADLYSISVPSYMSNGELINGWAVYAPYGPIPTDLTVPLDYDSPSIPSIEAVASNSNATVDIVNASDFTPGLNVAAITVTARDGVTKKVYAIAFTRNPEDNANLSSITLSRGEVNEPLLPATTIYSATVPFNSNYSAPTITATAGSSGATIEVSNPADFNANDHTSQGQVKVTAANGRVKYFNIYFFLALPGPEDLSITGSSTLQSAREGQSYSVDFGSSAVGGTAPFTWFAENLPDGMTMSSTGELSGTPATEGTYSVDVMVIDNAGFNKTKTYDLTVEPSSQSNSPPARKSGVTATATVSVMVNTAYTLDLATIFEDADTDALTYKVSVNEAAEIEDDAVYAYTPTVAGFTTLVFKANDGMVDSTDTYTVFLTANAAPPVNTAPVRKAAVDATATASVTVNTAYTLDLATIFEDADADTLTYKVSVNGAAEIEAAVMETAGTGTSDTGANATYSYTPTAVGDTILVFKANDGTVDSTDTYTVTLTANAAPPVTDIEKVAVDKAALEIGYIAGDNAATVTQNLSLSVTGSVYGSTITWVSNNTAVISNSGVVTRPTYASGDANVTVTASVYNNEASDTKEFSLKVLKLAQPTYTVTFKDWDGTTLKIQTVNEGSSAIAPANLTRTGYTFASWDNVFTNITIDLIVTAQYSVNSYTVSFNTEGGSTVNNQTVTYNGKATNPTDPTKSGFTFDGWYSDSSLTTLFDFSNTTITEDKTIYAKWTLPTLNSIAITTPATKLMYTVGENLDISGMVVTGTYSDSSTKAETITTSNVTGFDSSAPAASQTLTVTAGGKTTTYIVTINAVPPVNTAPVRKAAVAATATASVTVNTAYILDLATIFEDADADTLTYKVSVNGAADTGANANYSYTPASTGTTSLVFKANDGTVDSTDTYTVTLTANAASSGGNPTTPPATPSAETPQTETTITGNTATTTTTTTATVDNNGKATAAVTQEQVSDAISQALAEAQKQGGGTAAVVKIKVEASADATMVETSIPKEAMELAADGKTAALIVSTPIASISFDADALSAISGEAAEDVKITASRVEASAFSAEVQQAVGDRPVFNFSVTSGDKTISEFGGSVSVAVPYTPKAGEDTDSIVIYYINAEGNLEIVSNCIYDPATGTVSFKTNHFSQYAIGYNKVSFKDVAANAWYGKAVGFIAARGITAGTGNGNYSPDAKLTRGEFLVMMMRAYGMMPDTGLTNNFADAGNTYYTGYLAAAKRLGISGGVGNNMFAPGKEITRQEMFTLLYNALKVIGELPEGNTGKPLSEFRDSAQIASWAKAAMKLMSETGTISGSGGKLSPASTTTRAEMAQVLYNLLSK